MNTSVQAIPDVLERLRVLDPPGGRVLSAYFDTSSGRVQGQAYLLSYRDQCKALREALPPGELPAFEAAAAQAERYLTRELVPGQPGTAVFAAGEPSYFTVVALPQRPLESLHWGARPDLGPLQAVLDNYERVAVLLFDKERARLFTVYLGAIEEQRELLDVVPGKQATGGWFALAQSRYARHHEVHVLRHAQHTVAALTELLRTRPFDRLLLAGPAEALALLRAHLPRPLKSRLAGTLRLELFANEAEVLQATLAAAENLERQSEVAAVQELIEATSTPRVALGLEDTLVALSEDRVHRLFLADTFDGMGGTCAVCARLVAGADTCPVCGARKLLPGQLREQVIERALAQGAGVETVSGEAAKLLRRCDGIGAWTRFAGAGSE
jgi:hypothetical protein